MVFDHSCPTRRNGLKPVFNHLALLTHSVLQAAALFREQTYVVGELTEFPRDGTREIYIGDTESESGLLLLVEPLGDGSYKRALHKRGPGIHHIAIDVSDLNSYIASLSGTGWFLLPNSIETIGDHQTAWLARPGFPALIEVKQGGVGRSEKKAVITNAEISLRPELVSLLNALGVSEIRPSADQQTWITFSNGQRLSIGQLTGTPQ